VVVEIQSWEKVAVHDDVARVVDVWLKGYPIDPETRWLNEAGQVMKERDIKASYQTSHAPHVPDLEPDLDEPMGERPEVRRVFLFGIGRERVLQARQNTGLSVDVVNELRTSDVVLTTKSHYRRGPQLVRAAEKSGKPVYVLRKNSLDQVEQFLRTMAKEQDDGSHLEAALQEAQDAAQNVLNGAKSVELTPQRAYVRRLQHLLAERYHISSTSSGKDPQRRVTVFRV
jgi:ABC-type Fe3+-hydroxamate transport system substrate-binding protein